MSQTCLSGSWAVPAVIPLSRGARGVWLLAVPAVSPSPLERVGVRLTSCLVEAKYW